MTGRALASDFDGTLYFTGGHPSRRLRRFLPQDLEAIREFQAAGGLFGICTGRPVCGVLNYTRRRLRLDFLIACSGAVVIAGEDQPIESHELDRDLAARVIAVGGARGRAPFAAVGGRFYALGLRGPRLPFALSPARSLDDVEGAVHSLSFQPGDEGDARELAARINEAFAGEVVAYQNVDCVDVVAPGCSKGSGVRAVKAHFGVDVMGGIGDSYNDLPLLAASDVAYTFRRAPEGVRDAADVLVDTEAEALADLSRR